MSERICPYCQSPLSGDIASESCPTCEAGYHDDCWTEAGGCVVPGCVVDTQPAGDPGPVTATQNGSPTYWQPADAPATPPRPAPTHVPGVPRPSPSPEPQRAPAPPTLPPPGWYQDPSGRYDTRWWNGRSWAPDVQLRGIRLSDPPPGWSEG